MIKLQTLLTAMAASASLLAQSPLVINPTGPAYGWNPPPATGQTFFNLTVTNAVTLQAIDLPVFTAAGTIGTIQVYLTNPGTTTFIGNTQNAAVWSLVASGAITAKGSVGSLANLTATSCQMATAAAGGLVLAPGSYGVAIRYLNVAPAFIAVNGVQTFTNADLSVSDGTTQYTAFASASPAPVAGSTGWNFWGAIRYVPGAASHACSEKSNYGSGCYTIAGSTYQEFITAPTAQAALQGKALIFTPTGSSYLMTQGAGVLIPQVAPTALPATDDGEATITLTGTLTYPGGTTNQLFVHSNGYVSVGSNNTLPNGALNYVPEIIPMLAATNAAWWAWHDHNPTEVGSGLIDWEELGTLVVITYRDVESYPTTAANRSTVQFQIDTATGIVTIVFQTIAAGGSGVLQGDDWLIGFSPGGDSPDAGPFSITTLTNLQLNFPEQFALKLDASANPVLGTTVNLVTTRETIPGIGLNFVSIVQIPAPGFDLGIIGGGGCAALVDINAGVGNVISNLGLPGLSMTIPFPLPLNPTLAGGLVFSQSIWLDPVQNALGIITSDAVRLLLGTF